MSIALGFTSISISMELTNVPLKDGLKKSDELS